MRAIRLLLYALVGLAVAVIVGGQLGLLRGHAPGDLGVREGRLKPPSSTPNSVSSQAALHPGHPMQAYASVAPLPLRGDGPTSLAALQVLLSGLPGVHVIERREDYLHAECATPVLGFVDDLEFWVDPAAQAIQVRSASRLGRKDFGVNRERVEAIRSRWLATR